MTLWGTAPATGRQGLNFRKDTVAPRGYGAEVVRALGLNLGLLAVLLFVGARMLPLEETASLNGVPGPVPVNTQTIAPAATLPITLAAIN